MNNIKKEYDILEGSYEYYLHNLNNIQKNNKKYMSQLENIVIARQIEIIGSAMMTIRYTLDHAFATKSEGEDNNDKRRSIK